MRIRLSKTLAFGIVGFTLMGAAGGAQADANAEWYGRYFQPQQMRGLGGPLSASRPSITGKRETTTRQTRRSQGVRTASLGRPDVPQRRRSVTGGGVNWVASSGCLNGSLRGVIHGIASSFGSVTVSSTCRSGAHNRRVGGASKSYHLTGDAADFRVSGNVSAAYAALRSNGSIGGIKHYGGGLFHIDTGPRRSW